MERTEQRPTNTWNSSPRLDYRNRSTSGRMDDFAIRFVLRGMLDRWTYAEQEDVSEKHAACLT